MEFLVDAYGYRTSLSRLGLRGRVERHDRNHIEDWFHTFKKRTDRFHTCWWAVGRPSSCGASTFGGITTVSGRIKRSTAKLPRRC